MDPNVRAAKGDHAHLADFKAALAAGLLPIALVSSHPSIVFRWPIPFVHAPMQQGMQAKANHQTHSWRDALWSEAWVFALFQMKRATHLFSNAYTTVQEYKLEVQQLKSAFEEASKDLEKKLLILTEFRMRIGHEQFQTDLDDESLRSATDVCIKQVQRSMDELEKANATT
jgi:hypothetical protein